MLWKYTLIVTLTLAMPMAAMAQTIRDFASPNALRVLEGIGIGTSIPGSPQVADAFAQLHGEAYASSKEASAQMQRRFTNLMPNGREIVSVESLKKHTNRWGTVTGDWTGRKHIEMYSGYDLLACGFAIGTDITPKPNLLLGVALGYDISSQDFKSIRSENQTDSLRTMVYGSWFNGEYFVDGYGGYTKNFHDVERKINIVDNNNDLFTGVARGRYNDDLGSFGADFGKLVKCGDHLLTPSIGLHYIHLFSPGVTEKDAGDANLHIHRHTYQSVRMPIGIKASQIVVGKHGGLWMPEVRVFYVREFADDSVRVRTSFDADRDVTFDAESGKWGRNSGRFGVGVNAKLSSRMNFRLDYDCEVYDHTSTNVVSTMFCMKW